MSHCQISTLAPGTAAQPLPTLTTLMVSVSNVPARPSRMSLRTRSVKDGNGPIVSLGVSAHEPDDPPEELVGASEQPRASAAPVAPSTPRTSLRASCGGARVLARARVGCFPRPVFLSRLCITLLSLTERGMNSCPIRYAPP